jgi:hypothetical protein
MRTCRFVLCAIAVLFFSFSASSYAESYTALIGDIPGIDSLMSMTKTLGEDMNVKLDIKKVPIQRMVNMIVTKQADFGAPMLKLKDPNAIKNLPFDYSTGTVQQMCFILYTNKTKPVDIANLKSGNSKGYKIESDIANMQMFDFKTLPSTNPVASLKKVNDGLIDGYIVGSEPADSILKSTKDKMKNVKRQLWDTYDIGYALQKGARGGALDKVITEGIKKMKANGKLQKILSDVIKSGVYDDWLP